MFKFILRGKVFEDRMMTKKEYKAVSHWLRESCRIVKKSLGVQ